MPVEDALTAVLAVANYTWVKRGNIILITSVADSVNLPADVQGRQIQVFDLDFASAAGVSETVQNFLSPIGKVSDQREQPSQQPDDARADRRRGLARVVGADRRPTSHRSIGRRGRC